MEMYKIFPWYEDLPSSTLDIYEPNIELFFKTMYERLMIWKRRFIDKKERPWTKDKILDKYKFTNVYRDLDKNSQWEIKNIILDNDLTLKNLVWKIMVFRFFNNPKTFTFNAKEKITEGNLFNCRKLMSASRWRNGIPDFDKYNEDEFSDFIKNVRESGQNPYTSAYLINSMAAPKKDRDYCYTRVVIPALHENINNIIKSVLSSKTPEELISILEKLPGVARFIAHEFFQDFTYISKYTDRKFMKWTQNDYTNVGPGASVGIRLIYPSLRGFKNQKKAIYLLRDNASKYLDKISNQRGEKTPYVAFNKKTRKYEIVKECNITLHQIEMWLCEFQKYWKMQIGKGKQRSEFIPTTKNIIV
jgi:hypothetical protein